MPGLELRTVGRPSTLSAVYLRDLTPQDAATAMTERRPTADVATLKRLRHRHHELARMLAGGASEGEAALALGYTSARVSVLKTDPAFRELLAFYGGVVDDAFKDLQKQLAGVASDAVDELQSRLDEAPEDFSTRDLLAIATMGADRTGFGPKTTQEVDVRIGIAERLAAARARMRDITPSAA